jgi:hypothetical protein
MKKMTRKELEAAIQAKQEVFGVRQDVCGPANPVMQTFKSPPQFEKDRFDRNNRYSTDNGYWVFYKNSWCAWADFQKKRQQP